ncbi:hypothetical protein GSY74_03240 [Sulfurovum sp. bin170]|uniref:hypothetical protein n=1 Tax=Sulfurovum sp. bin170 TaxID=2695268 RepID=UPI0013DEA3EB|nr:hypothetical protein [Sulfurovum sp. bin170]NEW60288.1 hypothetical protein [Sulfurovum sp. bin170]
MVRKTITIQNDLLSSLELNQIIGQYKSFSELVSSALQLMIEKQQKEQYKKALIKASNDKLYIQDMQEIEDDFRFVDSERF